MDPVNPVQNTCIGQPPSEVLYYRSLESSVRSAMRSRRKAAVSFA